MTYQAIYHNEFSSLMADMVFDNLSLKGCAEYVYQRTINNGPNPGRYAVRIYSSIDSSGVTREVGSDAIRVVLVDLTTDKMIESWRTNRTQNALVNVKKNARVAWGYVMDHHNHCDCGGLMVERKGKNGNFLGCSMYPVCKATRKIVMAA